MPVPGQRRDLKEPRRQALERKAARAMIARRGIVEHATGDDRGMHLFDAERIHHAEHASLHHTRA